MEYGLFRAWISLICSHGQGTLAGRIGGELVVTSLSDALLDLAKEPLDPAAGAVKKRASARSILTRGGRS
jgi:hypothetical protein